MRSALLRRGATLVAASALTISTLGAVSAPAQAHPVGDRAVDAAATWLVGELKDGLLQGKYGPEVGPSIDAGLGLAEVGRSAGVAAVDAALRAGIDNYISGDAWGDTDSTYAGPTAKAATFATVAGQDPRAYGGVDLIARLESRVATEAPIEGRISDASAYGDYANVIGQSFAARALTTVGSPRALAAESFLLDQQCAAGYFRFNLTEDVTSTEQGCVEGADDSKPSLDVTALAVINLLATPNADPLTAAAAQAGAAWLKTQQAADGAFSDGGTEGVNTNTTGLAAWALAEAGETASAVKAATWLRRVQIADLAPCATALSAENGALAPTTAAFAAAREVGAIKPAQRLSHAFATAQALPALAHVPAASAPLAISAPATAVERSGVVVSVSGLGAGEPGCVWFGSASFPVVGTGDVVSVGFDLPAGVATHTFTVTTLAGSQSAKTTSTALPAPAPATPEVGTLVTKKVVTARNNWFKVAVDCDDTEWCDGKIVVRTLRKVRTGSNAPASKVLVAKRTYSVAPNTDEVLRLRVRKPARRLLDDGRTRVKAVQTAAGADRATTKFWLRAK